MSELKIPMIRSPSILRFVQAALDEIVSHVIEAHHGSIDSARLLYGLLPTPLKTELLQIAEQANGQAEKIP